jgi:flotillin
MDLVIAVGIGAILVVALVIWISVSLYRKVGPNEALIVFGSGGTQIAVGGGRIVWPFIQDARKLSLELMSFDVAPKQDYYTKQGVAVTVEAVAQIKVKNDPVSIRTAAEQLLTKNATDREGLIRLVMEGHLRGIVGQLTVEQIVKEPEMVGERMRSNSADDLAKMGLEVVSFTIREVRDKNEYIINMGKPDIARIRRDADVAAAEAERDTAIRRADTLREASVARAQADQDRVIAETASQTRQAEATRDLEVKKAEYTASVQRQKASADKAYDIQTAVMDQQVIAEKVRIDRVRKEEETKVQEAEIARREKELIATVLKQAEVEKKRIETIADADRQRKVLEASGIADSVRLQGQAEADVTVARGKGAAEAIKEQGLAEAIVIKAKGEAEAAAMTLKAAAYHEYNQAAILDKLLTGMPELARAMSEPLSKVDKITIVSTGDGANGKGGFGANQITGDMSKMIAQVPALFETLTGMKIGDMMSQVPVIKAAMNGNGNGNGSAKLDSTVEAPVTEPAPTQLN